MDLESCSNVCSKPGGLDRHVAASGELKRGRNELKRTLAAHPELSATAVRDREGPGSNPGAPDQIRTQTRAGDGAKRWSAEIDVARMYH